MTKPWVFRLSQSHNIMGDLGSIATSILTFRYELIIILLPKLKLFAEMKLFPEMDIWKNKIEHTFIVNTSTSSFNEFDVQKSHEFQWICIQASTWLAIEISWIAECRKDFLFKPTFYELIYNSFNFTSKKYLHQYGVLSLQPQAMLFTNGYFLVSFQFICFQLVFPLSLFFRLCYIGLSQINKCSVFY